MEGRGLSLPQACTGPCSANSSGPHSTMLASELDGCHARISSSCTSCFWGIRRCSLLQGATGAGQPGWML